MRRSIVLAALTGKDGQEEGTGPKATGAEQRTAIGGGFGPLLGRKPFRTPSLKSNAEDSTSRGRKRRRVNYTGMDEGEETSSKDAFIDDEQDGKTLKGKSGKKFEVTWKGVDAAGRSLKADNRKWPVFQTKEKALQRRFNIPVMKNQKGETIETRSTTVALGMRRPIDVPPRPLHDPMAEHAIVLFDPTVDDREAELRKQELQRQQEAAEQEVQQERAIKAGPHKKLSDILGLNRRKPDVAIKVPVVIDPLLAKVLRPHQIEGVKFLYRCTTGLIVENAYGCIMADEMGLGKTLQCIALMWTLLKQSPIPGKQTIDKCIIACPSSLVRNWANELIKWLGSSAPGTLALDGKLSKVEATDAVKRWCAAKGRSSATPVLIVSYETLRTLTDSIGETEVGLLLCDEGHRLKNSENLTFQSLCQLNVKRRVILSGTPIQNDLSEYFSLLNFANPDLLGSRLEFRKNFELDILRGRDADANDKEQEISNKKLQELSALVSKFIIRRTNDLLSKYLPVKHEHVVFCKMAPLQLSLYRHFIESPEIKILLRGAGSQPLVAINLLKKLCNHPDLLNLPKDISGSERCLGEYKAKDRRDVHAEYSGKLLVLERFLHSIKRTTNDKIVLISNYTQTLDLFERMCRINRWGSFRLDGTMAINKRQKLVDQFNNPEAPEFVFLLSSKAGGCGLNLIGANRLVLFDPDWNPASDQQALARVWRDGQKKTCFVYRFIGTGSIEEKILQRQSHKQTLSSCVVDEAQDAARHFSGNDLRELFTFKDKTVCDTHDTYKCKRCCGGKQQVKAPAMLYGDASTWNHYEKPELGRLHDDLLRQEMAHDDVSFVFHYCSH